MQKGVAILAFVLQACSSTPDDPGSAESGGGSSGGSTTGGAASGGAVTNVAGTSAAGTSSVAGTSSSGGSGGSGGSTASAGTTAGGSGGSAGSPVLDVKDCSGLAEAGQWENITPEGAAVPNVMTNPLAPGELYVGTSQKGVFKSTDCGASWTKVNTGSNGDVLDTGTPWLFALDPVTPNVLYADAFGGSESNLFRSTNGGVDWEPLWTVDGVVGQAAEYLSPELMSIDPTDHTHIVVAIHANCKAPHPGLCFAESNDSGDTWSIVDGPSDAGGWVEDASPVIVNATTFMLGSAWKEMLLTTDDGESWSTVSDNGGLRLVTGGEWSYIGGAFNVQRSKDLKTWTKLDNTPGLVGFAMATDGTTLFAASRSGINYKTSPVSDGATWTTMTPPSPLADGDGAYSLAIDTTHHVLYSANQGSGLFRVVTN